MRTIDKLEQLKQKLYKEIQQDIKKYGFTKIVGLGVKKTTLFRIIKNKYISDKKLIEIKKIIDGSK